MTRLTAEQVKRDNSNVFRYSKQLASALRRERFSTIRLHDYFIHQLTTSGGVVNPYEDCDLKMDLDKFRSLLNPDIQGLFDMYLQGMTAKEMHEETGRSLPNVYYWLHRINDSFREFYTKDGEI